MPDTQPFEGWLHDQVVAAGYDLSSPRAGGKTKLAKDAGIALSQVQRALNGTAVPDIRAQRSIARALKIPFRTMLIRSGTLRPDDFDQDDPQPADRDARTLGLRLGVPAERLGQFAAIVESLAATFDEDQGRPASADNPTGE